MPVYKIPRPELLHLFGVTQHFGVDLLVVLTQQRRGSHLPSESSRRTGQPGMMNDPARFCTSVKEPRSAGGIVHDLIPHGRRECRAATAVITCVWCASAVAANMVLTSSRRAAGLGVR
jgi:hypothetical protein